MGHFADLARSIAPEQSKRISGKVVGVKGTLIRALLPFGAVGDLCQVETRHRTPLLAQIVSFQGESVSLAPFGSVEGVFPGSPVTSDGRRLSLPLDSSIVGSVVDVFGQPFDGGRHLRSNESRGEGGSADRFGSSSKGVVRIPILQAPPCATRRLPIDTQFITGVRALDLLCPIGCGQRMGLFAGAGVGKSTLLGMIARNSVADINVIALVGERGREVNEFLEDALGPAGLARSVVVVCTSDEPSQRRMLAAYTATAIAEYFRDQGKRVLLLVDSLTRMARALREVGLADGELPVRHGYTPSVYTELPKLLERSGTNERGSITAIYTVLTSGEIEEDPLAEEVKSLLDGHLVLSTAVTAQGVRPSIDFTRSISRLAHRLATRAQALHGDRLRSILHRLKRDRDIVLLGGTPDRDLARALEMESSIVKFLSQTPWEKIELEAGAAALSALLAEFDR